MARSHLLSVAAGLSPIRVPTGDELDAADRVPDRGICARLESPVSRLHQCWHLLLGPCPCVRVERVVSDSVQVFHSRTAGVEGDMAGIAKKNFETPDERRTPDKTVVQVVDLGSVKAARMTLQPG